MSLSLMPCTDLGLIEDTANVAEVHDHQHDDADSCSPFCICACCGVVYNFEFNQVVLPEVAVQIDKKFPNYASNLYSNEFLFIWKPPKVS